MVKLPMIPLLILFKIILKIHHAHLREISNQIIVHSNFIIYNHRFAMLPSEIFFVNLVAS